MFHRRAEIPAKRASPANRASPPHVIGPLSFTLLNLKFNDGVIGGVSPQGQPGLASAFTERFKFIWIPSKRAALIIFNVTTVENGTFSYVVTAFDSANFASKTWTSKIQVKFVVSSKFIFSSV